MIDHTEPKDRDCKSCGAPMKFIATAKGSKAPVDWPDDASLRVRTWQEGEDDPDVKWYDEVGKFHQGAKAGDVGMISHFSTCDNPNRFSRKGKKAE